MYLLDDDTALVQTMDVITPVVDDPFDFGFIAAVNALSDIFAMGGVPLTAMSFLAFETCTLAIDAASGILRGGLAALKEAGCTLVGGHTIEDSEIKFGLAVTGTVPRDGIVTNAGAMPGDHIYLTKPLGTGIASTALKGELLPASLLEEAVHWMKTMNSDASGTAVENSATAMTDVTGFGLLGHLAEMCTAAGIGAEIDHTAVPVMDGILEMIRMGMVPTGAYDNIRHIEEMIEQGSLSRDELLPLYDPQTSGGLLISMPAGNSSDLEKGLRDKGVFFKRIGRFLNSGDKIVIHR